MSALHEPSQPHEPAETPQGREATRQALLHAAMTLFHDRGYAATTADDISAATGRTKGAFYFHFASKEACFLEVLAYRARLRGDWYRIPENLDRSLSLEQVLQATMAELARRMDGRPSFAIAMADFWLTPDHRDGTSELFARSYSGWIQEVAAFIGSLQRSGHVDPAVDAQAVAPRVLGLVDGLAIHSRLYGVETNATLFAGIRTLLIP